MNKDGFLFVEGKVFTFSTAGDLGVQLWGLSHKPGNYWKLYQKSRQTQGRGVTVRVYKEYSCEFCNK